MYRNHNGRVEKLEFHQSFTSNGPRTIDIWVDVGPATPPRRFNRAVNVMEKLEKKNRTDSRIYHVARQIAINELGK